MRKKEQLKLEERRRQQKVGRWMVAVVLILTLVITMGFWWQGRLKSEVKEWVEPETTVWDSAEQNNKQQPTDNKQLTVIDTSELKNQIQALVTGKKGKYVIYAKNIKYQISNIKNKGDYLNWEFEVGPEGEEFMNEPMQAASLIKVPVMVAMYRMAERGESFDGTQDKIDLDEIYKLRDADRVGGSGSLIGKPSGYEVSYRKLLWHMGNESDNTAFAAIVNHFGEEKLQEEFLKMGLLNVSISENEVAPKEIVSLFQCLSVYSCVKKESAEEMLEAMTETWYEDRIPAGVKAAISNQQSVNGKEEEVRIAHKVGTEVGVISDAGIVFAEQLYMLVIMTEEVREIEAKETAVGISKAVWEWQRQTKN